MLFMICAENLLQQMLKTFYNRHSKKYDFSQNIYFLCEILSKIVLKKLEIMFMAIAFHKIFTACHTDENRIKQGSNLNIADKGVAKPMRGSRNFHERGSNEIGNFWSQTRGGGGGGSKPPKNPEITFF